MFSNKELQLLFQTALAHLESLAVDVEVANPPASKESIDGLPETLVLEDHTGKGKADLKYWMTRAACLSILYVHLEDEVLAY